MSIYFIGEEQTLQDILTSREERVQYQQYLLNKFGYTIVSYKLNIPGPIKYNSLIKQIFDEGLLVFKSKLEQNLMKVLHEQVTYKNSGPEYFAVINISSYIIKQVSTKIEEMHPLGRVYDYDVLNSKGTHIDRQELGIEARKCLLCDKNAFQCGRSRNHEVSELIDKIEKMALDYFYLGSDRIVRPIKITETALRDAHQSLIATRLKTEEILPILEKMDNVGYYSLEVWGGATFDSCLRFLNEDPWERLREIRKVVKKTKLQMLLRGQNLLGYKHYADDVVEEFIKKSIENGIDIIRVFDALNDTRNMATSIRAIKEAGGHCQCAISYTTSKVHTLDYYVELSKKMEELGADSICIKDMAGVLTPYSAYELVKRLKEVIKIPLGIHSHCTGGIASMTYLKAVEAGVDIIDTAISPFSEGTSQPPTESLVLTLKESPRDSKLDINLLGEIADYFKPIRDEYRENGILNSKVMDVEPKTITYQVPGGMLSNLLSQLKAQGAESRYEEVLREIPKVRADLGFPPLVTPLSQMVGTQSVFNVLSGERYKMVPKEIKEYVKGYYGSSPAPIKDEVRKKIIGDEKVITVRPADLIEPELLKYKKEIGDLAKTNEDVLSYVLFPPVAKKFFEDRLSGNINNTGDSDEKIHYITVTM